MPSEIPALRVRIAGRSPRLWSVRVFAVTLVALAVSGEAAAYTRFKSDSGAYLFWPNVTATPVQFQIDAQGSADIADGSDVEAVKAGIAAWTSLACTSLKARYAGPTATNNHATDSTNKIFWLESNWPPEAGSNVVGLTTPVNRPNGEIVDADIRFNGVNFDWTTTGQAGRFDIAGVATHELGHAFGLDHEPGIPEATMNPGYSPGAPTPEPDDIAGMCAIYPARTGATSSPCTANADCTGGRLCASHAGTTLCSEVCGDGLPACPSGFACRGAANGPKACIQPTPGRSASAGVPAVADLCNACNGEGDCSTGLCVYGDDPDTSVCSQPCPCPEGFDCAEDDTGEKFCLPKIGAACIRPEPVTGEADTGPIEPDAPAGVDGPSTDGSPTEGGSTDGAANTGLPGEADGDETGSGTAADETTGDTTDDTTDNAGGCSATPREDGPARFGPFALFTGLMLLGLASRARRQRPYSTSNPFHTPPNPRSP